MRYYGVSIKGVGGWVGGGSSQGKHKRRTSRDRVDVLSSNLRMGEYVGAEKVVEYTEGANAQTAHDI